MPGRCDGATSVDPPICLEPGNLLNLSADNCPCSVNGDCVGNCVGGSCAAGGTAAACVGTGNGMNLSPDGCPCAVNGDCAGNCDPQTRTCGGVVGRVFDRLPILGAEAERGEILVGESTRDLATVSNAKRWPSSIRFSLYNPANAACAVATAGSTVAHDGTAVVPSAPVVAGTTGTWRWRAEYLGNAWNRAQATSCASATQRVVVDLRLFADGFE